MLMPSPARILENDCSRVWVSCWREFCGEGCDEGTSGVMEDCDEELLELRYSRSGRESKYGFERS